MTLCAALTERASDGVAAALRAVDCLANETTSAAFGRLFGTNGALLPVLTIILTLYIAFFAISLLTGRSRLGISALTPRMMTLGLVLTFATSWVAYQSVVWNLAVGAPDQVAGILMGGVKDGGASATQLFGDRIDIIFAAIADAANNTSVGQGASDVARTAAQGSFSPGNLMWLAALLLMLGTVGVLVTARIALAVLLALGPVFVVFALFPGTRGLTAGWLRGLVMTAATPLFVVVGGGIMLELLVPVVANLSAGTGIDGRASVALFVIAAVHVALMGMVLKVVGSMVAAWNVFGLAGRESDTNRPVSDPAVVSVNGVNVNGGTVTGTQQTAASPSRRVLIAATPTTLAVAMPASSAPNSQGGRGATMVTQISGSAASVPVLARQRARGVGSRFSTTPRHAREISR
ncbi:MAG: type IV secretion system protein [Novosphingobium sp.]